MRPRLKISQKGLVLVALPLLSTLVYISILVGLLRQAEAEILQQVQMKSVLYQAATLSRLFNDAGVAVRGYYLTEDKLFSAPYDDIVQKIRKQFERTKTSDDAILIALAKDKEKIAAGEKIDVPKAAA